MYKELHSRPIAVNDNVRPGRPYGGPRTTRLGGRAAPLFELTALRITLIYVTLGLVALVFSDLVIVPLLPEPLLSQIQALKGAIEVLLSGGLIFALARTHERQLTRVSSEMEGQRDELGLLHRVVRHNLRNDFNVIYGLIDLIRSKQTSADASEDFEKLFDKLDEMEEDIEHLRRIREVTSGGLGTVTIDVSEAIQTLLREHPDVTDEVGVSVSTPDDLEVECSPLLSEAIGELVTNAIRHNDSDTPEFAVEVDPDAGPPGMVAINVTDNGPGIPPMELKAHEADADSQLMHSNGLGIWFVDWMVSHSGGELHLERSDGGGTRVTLLLPEA